jgi:hypothetical protein
MLHGDTLVVATIEEAFMASQDVGAVDDGDLTAGEFASFWGVAPDAFEWIKADGMPFKEATS